MIYFLQCHRHDSVAEFTFNDSTAILRGHKGEGGPGVISGEAAPGVISSGHCCKCFADDLDTIATEHLHLHYLY